MNTSLNSPLHICISRAMLVADGGWGMFPKQCTCTRKMGKYGALASSCISFGEALQHTSSFRQPALSFMNPVFPVWAGNWQFSPAGTVSFRGTRPQGVATLRIGDACQKSDFDPMRSRTANYLPIRGTLPL